MTDSLREIDQAVLEAVEQGYDDAHKIKMNTVYSNNRIGYSLEKLEDQGLLVLEKPEGMVERSVEGQKRVFKAPVEAELTKEGEQHLQKSERAVLESYEDMDREELVETVRSLESRVDTLERSLETFRKQVFEKLE